MSTWRQNDQFFVLVSKPLRTNSIPEELVDAFASRVTWNNRKVITETRSLIFKWRPCTRRSRLCLKHIMLVSKMQHHVYDECIVLCIPRIILEKLYPFRDCFYFHCSYPRWFVCQHFFGSENLLNKAVKSLKLLRARGTRSTTRARCSRIAR